MKGKETTKVTIIEVLEMLEKLKREREQNVELEKEISEIKKDIEKLKFIKKCMIKIGTITMSTPAVAITVLTAAMEKALFMDEASFFEQFLPNIILTVGGVYIGVNLIPYIIPFLEAKELEDEIYEENPELKPIKKARRLTK